MYLSVYVGILDSKRRKLAKSFAVGVGAVASVNALPDRWTKPVVDSVLLPAHAACSPCLVEAVYCNESKATRISVYESGRVFLRTYDGQSEAIDIDPCEGGSFEIEVMFVTIGPEGDGIVRYATFSGSIPCGETDSIEIMVAPPGRTEIFSKDYCSS